MQVTIVIGDTPNITSPLQVTLSGADPTIASVPTSVTIPAGANSVAFGVTGVKVGNTSLTASAANHASDSVAINVRQNQIVLPPSVLVPVAGNVQFPVTLSDPAPAGGLTVTLTTTSPGTGTVDSPLVIPAGATVAQATARGLATDKHNTVTANAPNFNGTSTLLQVETITASYSNPNDVFVGIQVPVTTSWVTRSVVLSDAAPPGGLTLSLSVGNPALASTSPASVTVPAGQLTSPAFAINGLQQSSTATTLTAAATGVTSAVVNLTIGPPPALNPPNFGSALTVAAGMHRDFVGLTLNTPAPPTGLTINFSSSNPTQVAAPASIAIPAGATQATFTVTGLVATGAAPATITASATTGAVVWQPQGLQVNVVQPVLVLFGVQTPRAVSGAPNPINAEFCIAAFNCPDALNAAQTVTFSLSNNTTDVTVSPTAVSVPANDFATSQILPQVLINLSTPGIGGTYSVNATDTGFATAATPVAVTVSQPAIIALNQGSPLTVGVGMHRDFVFIQTDTVAPAGGLTVTFTSSNPGQVAAPAPIAIAANTQSGSFTVTALQATVNPTTGANQPVTITANATSGNVVWQSATLQVTAVQPLLVLFGVTNPRTVAAAPDPIGVEFCVLQTFNCPDSLNTAQTVALSVSNDTAGGVTVSPASVTVPANDLSSSQIQPPLALDLSPPTQGGSYTVNATDTGFATDASPVVVTVNQPAITSLNFGAPLTVAAGMHRDFISLQTDTPAPGGGLTITFASSDPTLVAAPASIVLLSGSQSGSFTVAGLATTPANLPVTITASATSGGVVWKSQALQVNVVQPVLEFFNVTTPRTVGAAPASIGVQFCIAAFNCPDSLNAAQTVTFSVANDTAGVTVSPSSITVPANDVATSQVQPPVNLSTPTQTGSYTVNATSTGFAIDASPVTVTVNQPAIIAINFGSPLTAVAGMHRDSVLVQTDTPAPAGGLTVNLASTDSTVATVPVSIVIPAGSQQGSFTLMGISTGTQPTQSVQVTASAQGWISQTLNVTIVQPVLFVSGVATSRTVNGPANNFSVQVCVAAFNCPDTLNAPLTVTFDVGSTQIVTVLPAQQTIPAASDFAQATVSSPTAAGNYTLTVSAPGFTPVSFQVTVN